jgi:hypothetical protein
MLVVLDCMMNMNAATSQTMQVLHCNNYWKCYQLLDGVFLLAHPET